MTDNVQLSKNDAENRFELRVDDNLIGKIDYRDRGSSIDMFHTEVDPAHGGQGYGQKLVEFALADARDNNYTVTPSCPFIARYIEDNPEYADLRA